MHGGRAVRTQGEAAVCEPGAESSPETSPAGTPPRISRALRNNVRCLRPQSAGLCYSGPSKPVHGRVVAGE